MVQRDLTHVITPSTRLDGNLRPEAVHLLALREVWSCETLNEVVSSSNVIINFILNCLSTTRVLLIILMFCIESPIYGHLTLRLDRMLWMGPKVVH